MIDNIHVANKLNQASRLVTIWSPWWGRYLGASKFSYGKHPRMRITGLSSMIFIVENEYIARSNIMDIAVTLEFALQQSARNMDGRGDHMLRKHEGIDPDLVGLAQALEINSDIESKFEQLDPVRWDFLVSRHVDKEYRETLDVTTPPVLPEGSWTSSSMGFPMGLRAEKYLDMLIEKDNDAESDYLENQAEQEDSQEEDSSTYPDDTPENSQEDSSTDEESSQYDSSEESESTEDDPQPSQGQQQGGTEDNNSDNEAGAEDGTDQDTPDLPDVPMESLDDPEGNEPGEGNGRGEGSGSGESSGDQDIYTEGSVSDSEGPTDENDTGTHKDDSDPSKGHRDSLNDVSESDDQEQNQEPSGDQSEPDSGDTSEDSVGDSEGLTDENDTGTYKDDSDPSESHTDGLNDVSEGEEQSGDITYGNYEDDQKSNDSPENAQTEDIQPGEISEGHPSQEASVSELLGSDDNPQQQTQQNMKSEPFKSVADAARQSANDTGLHQMTIPDKPKVGEEDSEEEEEIIGATQHDREDIMNELAEDIDDFVKNIPQGAPLVGDDFTEFSGGRLRKPKGAWKSQLLRILDPMVSAARMSGQSDMSFSKRNPNQIEGHPIMMGFVSYPPEITILIDSSYSVIREKEKILSEFVGVMKTLFMKYAQPITVAIGDSEVRYAENSITPYRKIVKEAGKTHHGSSATFGETIESIAKKGVKIKGRVFPKPDLFIILTDCAFEWPWKDRAASPSNCGNIMVISTEPYEKAKGVLPRWVKERKNFVHIYE